jgi:hypothetical protein
VNAESRSVKVTARIDHVDDVDSPKFAVCPDLRGSVCDLGNLPVGQSDELQASVWVRKAAALDEKVKLTAQAKAAGATTFQASATVLVVASAVPATSTSLPASDTLPATTLPATTLPAVPALPNSGGNLFPTVTPSPSTSPGSLTPTPPGRHHEGVHAVTASAATLPLNPRLIGGQLAGLAVLAGAIAMAIARLSLRTPRPQDGKNPAK